MSDDICGRGEVIYGVPYELRGKVALLQHQNEINSEVSIHYYVASDEEKRGVCSEDYDLLLGPDGFQCFLGEREDRCWHRDAAPVVNLLNTLQAEVNQLRKELSQK